MKAKFKIGDRVEILTFVRVDSPEYKVETVRREPPQFGTIVYAPKTSRGSYLVAFDGGYILNGRDCPQSLHEQWLAPVEAVGANEPPHFKIGDRVQDAGGFHGFGTVASVGPEPYFDCGVRWDKPFWMDGEELHLEPMPQEKLLPCEFLLRNDAGELIPMVAERRKVARA